MPATTRRTRVLRRKHRTELGMGSQYEPFVCCRGWLGLAGAQRAANTDRIEELSACASCRWRKLPIQEPVSASVPASSAQNMMHHRLQDGGYAEAARDLDIERASGPEAHHRETQPRNTKPKRSISNQDETPSRRRAHDRLPKIAKTARPAPPDTPRIVLLRNPHTSRLVDPPSWQPVPTSWPLLDPSLAPTYSQGSR